MFQFVKKVYEKKHSEIIFSRDVGIDIKIIKKNKEIISIKFRVTILGANEDIKTEEGYMIGSGNVPFFDLVDRCVMVYIYF